MRKTALASLATVGLLAMSGGTAMALPPGDDALVPSDKFILDTDALEPGCFPIGAGENFLTLDGAESPFGMIEGVFQPGTVEIRVDDLMPFSVDQVLAPGTNGYRVHNVFDTGYGGTTDPDISHNQTAIVARDGSSQSNMQAIVCLSRQADGGVQNEPYVAIGGGQVAAKNRPIVTPKVSALGASAVGPLNTYKMGLGYSVANWYDMTWADFWDMDADPQAFDLWHANGAPGDDGLLDVLYIEPRVATAGAARINDIDEFGEEFNLIVDENLNRNEKASYGQTAGFLREGDPFSYLHKSLPNFDVDGTGGLNAIWEEMFGDHTSALGLLTFTAQGDLPIQWTLKPSMAEPDKVRSDTFTQADLRAWEQEWQAYYAGGPLPTLPLAPGTKSPDPKVGPVVNLPQTAVTVNVPNNGPAATAAPKTVQQPMAASSVVRVSRSSRIAKIRISKRIARRAHVTFMSANGLRVVNATRENGRLVAKVDLRGLEPKGTKWAVQVSGRNKKNQIVRYTVFLKL